MYVVFVPSFSKDMLPRNLRFTIVTTLKMLGALKSRFSLVSKYKTCSDISQTKEEEKRREFQCILVLTLKLRTLFYP